MATSKLLQSLDATFSDGTTRGITPSSRTQIETFIASQTIAANDLVALDIDNADIGKRVLNIKKADQSAPERVAVGFALDAGDAGDPIRVTISGYHKEANVKTYNAAVPEGVVQGAPFHVSAVAGQADVYKSTDADAVIGYAATTAVGNKADVIVLKQF